MFVSVKRPTTVYNLLIIYNLYPQTQKVMLENIHTKNEFKLK